MRRSVAALVLAVAAPSLTHRSDAQQGPAQPQPPPPVDPNAIPNSGFGEVAGRGYPLPLQPWAAALKKERGR